MTTLAGATMPALIGAGLAGLALWLVVREVLRQMD
jgi:hypothetical protein